MKALAVLLSLLIVLNAKTSYSIDEFLNYMHESGYYGLITQIKYSYGTDIAISFCKEIIKSEHCDLLVRIYIHCGTRGENEETGPLTSIIFNPDNYNLYKGKEYEIAMWIKKQNI